MVVVLLATIGFGWTLDRLFIELQPDEADRLAPYRVMGEALADSAGTGNDLVALTSTWPINSKVQLGILDTNELALPEPLQNSFTKGETLALEADEGVTLFVPVRGSDTALTLSLPPQTSRSVLP